MRRLALLVLLVAPSLLYAASYTCSGGGTKEWHTTTDWTPNGVPKAGDTATITPSCTMQCEAGQSCALGLAGSPGSTDLTIQAGGSLQVLSSATFDMRGIVSLLGELDVFGGTFTLDPAAAAANASYAIDGGTSTAQENLKICSEQSCNSTSGNIAVLTCNKGSSGSCQIRHTSFSGPGMNVLGSDGQISNFGTSSSYSISLFDGTHPNTGGFVLKNDFSLHNNGAVRVDYEVPSLDITFDGVSFDSLVDVNGSSNGYTFLELYSFQTPPTGDRTFRVTCANTGGRQALIYLDVLSPTSGDSSHLGWVSYNCALWKAAHGGTFQNGLSVIDRNYASGTSIATAYNADVTYENWVLYNHTPNQHQILGLAQSGGGSRNIYSHITFDGDGYVASDTGDDYQDLGNYTASYGLHVNDSGTAFTLSASNTQMASLDHETIYNSFGGALCEIGCAPTMFQKWSNSLFVKPATTLSPEYWGNDGMHNETAFNYSNRQTANSAATDYNFFWQMPGSGDPGANPAKNTYIQLNLGTTPSWVAMTTPEASIFRNQLVTITGGVNVSCSGCFQHAQAKDYIVDTTVQPNTYAVIESVANSNSAVLYTGIPRYNSTDRVDIRPGYFATNGLYGIDWGAHDQHINPYFQDNTRTVCSWWKEETGTPVNCSWPSLNNYTATAGTNSTTISDASLNFNNIGVKDGLDVVLVYSPGFGTVRGSATVVSHTSNTLTVSPAINGASSGDSFTFITAAQKLGQAVVQLYGWDINGNAVTPPSWVNSGMVQRIQSYLQQGYTPTNLGLYNAGSDGTTVGAFGVIPPSGAIMVSSN